MSFNSHLRFNEIRLKYVVDSLKDLTVVFQFSFEIQRGRKKKEIITDVPVFQFSFEIQLKAYIGATTPSRFPALF